MSTIAAEYPYSHDVTPLTRVLPQGKIQVQFLGLPSHSSTRPLQSVTEEGKEPLRYARYAGNPATGMTFRAHDLIYIYDPEYVNGTPGIQAQAQLAKSTMVTGGPMSTSSTAHMSLPYGFASLHDMPVDVKILAYAIAMDTYDPTQPITFITTGAIQMTDTIFNRSPYAFSPLDYVMWEYPNPASPPFGGDDENGGSLYVPVLVPLKRRLAQMVGDTVLCDQVRQSLYQFQSKAAEDEAVERKDTKNRYTFKKDSERPAKMMDWVLDTAEANHQEGTKTYGWLTRMSQGKLGRDEDNFIDSCNLIQKFACDAFDMAMTIENRVNTNVAGGSDHIHEAFLQLIFLRNFVNRKLLELKSKIASTTTYDMLTALLDAVTIEHGIMINSRLIESMRKQIVGICLSETKSLDHMDIYFKPGMFCTTSPVC